jgi:hypothetical protein
MNYFLTKSEFNFNFDFNLAISDFDSSNFKLKMSECCKHPPGFGRQNILAGKHFGGKHFGRKTFWRENILAGKHFGTIFSCHSHKISHHIHFTEQTLIFRNVFINKIGQMWNLETDVFTA